MVNLVVIEKRTIKIILLIGLVFLIISALYLIVELLIYSGYEKTQIFVQYLDYENEVSYTYYTFNGVLYENIFMESYVDSWETGHQLTGFVNPNNPNQMVAFLDMLILPAVIGIVPIICLAIIIPLVLFRVFVIKYIDKIKSYNNKLTCNVVQINPYYNNNYFTIIFKMKNILFESHRIKGNYLEWEDKLTKQEMQIDVYLNPKNPNQYYVDFNTIRQLLF